jgi:hypothetical protein
MHKVYMVLEVKEGMIWAFAAAVRSSRNGQEGSPPALASGH